MNPKRSRLGRFKSAEEYAGNARAEYAAARSQDDLRQALFRESELLGERDGEIRSGLRLKDKYEENKELGRVIKRTDRNEPAAPQTEDPAPSFITSNLRVPREVFDYVLKPRTLAAGEKTAGHLVFRNSEEQNTYLVWYLNAGQVEFVFPGESN